MSIQELLKDPVQIKDYQAEESPNESNIFNYNNLYENYI